MNPVSRNSVSRVYNAFTGIQCADTAALLLNNFPTNILYLIFFMRQNVLINTTNQNMTFEYYEDVIGSFSSLHSH